MTDKVKEKLKMLEIFVSNELECSENVQMIFDEYVAAVKKHPKLCDKFTAYSLLHAKHDEGLAKKKNAEPPYYADRILEEEIAEARTAFLKGNFAHTKQELAQCGAVVLRMMAFCDKMISK